MRYFMILMLLTAAMVAFGTAGCGDDVKVQRSYEGEAPPPAQQADEGDTVYQRNVQIESEGFDNANDDNEVKIQRSSETSTESQEMLITP